jgi:hypothetical protein
MFILRRKEQKEKGQYSILLFHHAIIYNKLFILDWLRYSTRRCKALKDREDTLLVQIGSIYVIMPIMQGT